MRVGINIPLGVQELGIDIADIMNAFDFIKDKNPDLPDNKIAQEVKKIANRSYADALPWAWLHGDNALLGTSSGSFPGSEEDKNLKMIGESLQRELVDEDTGHIKPPETVTGKVAEIGTFLTGIVKATSSIPR